MIFCDRQQLTAHSNTVRILERDRAGGGGDIGLLQPGNRFETGRIITPHPFICNRYTTNRHIQRARPTFLSPHPRLIKSKSG